MARWRLLVPIALGLAGCEPQQRAPAPAPPASLTASAAPVASVPPAAPLALTADVTRGKALVERFECHRCHEGTGLSALPRERHCVRCHQDIEAGKVNAPPGKLAEWKSGVAGVSHVPSLDAANRFAPGWIEEYLRDPHDLRPALVSTMPRLAISAEQAADIAAYLRARDASSAAAASAVPPGDPARGREIAVQRGCASCHAFSGVADWQAARGSGASVELAPDLRHARERLTPASIAAWLRDPRALKPRTLMPNLALDAEAVAHVTAFVTSAPLAPAAPGAAPRLPVLERPVSYAEVDEKVFSVTCRHCHSNTETAFGDGGPGFDGGFGFAPRRVDLSSHRGISSGMLADDGERHSLFERLADGTPRLVAALLARQAEEAGHPSPGLRGMPLGLPPLGPEQIQLVESWVAQGHPL